MKKIIGKLFLILSLFASMSIFAGDLSKAMIEDSITQMETAALNKDTSAIAELLSDDVKILLKFMIGGQKQMLVPTKSEYLALVQEGWDVVEDYKHSVSNVEIQINGNKAVVKSDVTESMTIQGQTSTGKSKQKTTVELIDGKLLITAIVSSGSI